VLTPEGGTLGWLRRRFRLTFGGWVGSGRTPVSWIGRDDLVGAIHHAIFADELRGPVNAVTPEPVSQVGLARAAGRVFRRPTLLPTLPLLVLLLGGERDRFLRLTGARVRPERLLASGFRFLAPEIEAAIRWESGRLPPDATVTFEES
jgi:NAD dependent epimerase/dehydratase family enzyme